VFQKTANDTDNPDIVADPQDTRFQTANAANYKLYSDTFTGGSVESPNGFWIHKRIHFHDYSPLPFLFAPLNFTINHFNKAVSGVDR
jgi:hypothetical protein